MSKSLFDGLDVLVQVAHHGVRVPSAQQFDVIRIDVTTEESHGTTGAERAGGDVLGRDACCVKTALRCVSELFCDVRCSHSVW